MWLVSFETGDRTANVWDAGRFIAMNAKRGGHLPDMTNAPAFTVACGERDEVSAI